MPASLRRVEKTAFANLHEKQERTFTEGLDDPFVVKRSFHSFNNDLIDRVVIVGLICEIAKNQAFNPPNALTAVLRPALKRRRDFSLT